MHCESEKTGHPKIHVMFHIFKYKYSVSMCVYSEGRLAVSEDIKIFVFPGLYEYHKILQSCMNLYSVQWFLATNYHHRRLATDTKRKARAREDRFVKIATL